MTDQPLPDMPVSADPPPVDPGPLVMGEPVEFTWTLHRKRSYDDQGWRNWWTNEHYTGQSEPERQAGILIGVRRLANGHTIYHGYEDGSEFVAEERFVAYLVAVSLHRRPVLVLPEHLTRMRP